MCCLCLMSESVEGQSAENHGERTCVMEETGQKKRAQWRSLKKLT
jgi:hypothetical protein